MARATQTLSLMAWPPHLSRWQLCAPLKAAATPVAPIATSCPPLSLRYLNEFVGKLQCAPALLDHELFPDAKEITESMALFNAVRRYVVSNNSPTWHDNGKRNGIIVVGDGTTPRTAALFAYRMPTWTSYSVDPALEKKETSKRAQGWSSISNLVVIRNKIENVRIQVNRAVLVLVHAHVTLEQALSAVDADDVVGVVTLPCCNWYGQQEVLFNRGPDLVYDDFSILSDHRELRLWLGEQRGPVHLNSSHADHSLTLRGLKGCVRKELREKTPRARVETDRRAEHVLDVLRAIFADGGQHGTRPDETSGSTLLPSTIASQIGTSTPVLALGSPSRRVIALMLLRDGYSNVYTISLTNDKRSSGTDCGQPHVQTLALQLCKCSIDLQHASVHEAEPEVEYEPCGVFHLHSTFGTDMLQEEAPEPVIVSYDPAGARVPPLACVIDAGFLARGLEGGTKKKHLPDLFRRLCRTLDKLVAACGRESRNDQIPALVCLTLRKHWRNKEFLAHTDLNYHVQSLAPAKEDVTATRVYVFCCFKHPIEQVSKTKSGEASSLEREVALKMYVTLEEQLSARVAEREGQVMVIDSVETYTRTSLAHEQSAVDLPPMYAQASGVITRVRRFRNGMTLVLLAFGGTDCKQELQLLLKRESLGWSLGMCTKVARLLRKGVEMTAVGAMVRASRGHSMLQVEALSLAHSSALETYN